MTNPPKYRYETEMYRHRAGDPLWPLREPEDALPKKAMLRAIIKVYPGWAFEGAAYERQLQILQERLEEKKAGDGELDLGDGNPLQYYAIHYIENSCGPDYLQLENQKSCSKAKIAHWQPRLMESQRKVCGWLKAELEAAEASGRKLRRMGNAEGHGF